MSTDQPQPSDLHPSVIASVAQAIADRLLAGSFSGTPALRGFSGQDAHVIARAHFNNSRGSREVDEGMRQRGLVGMMARARTYTPVSHKGKSKAISIVPYNSTNPQSNLVGAVGFSDGEPANGVIVELQDNAIVAFTTLDFMEGKYSERRLTAEEFTRGGPQKFVEERKRGNLEPDIPIDSSASIATDAFKVFLQDEYASGLYSRDQVQKLYGNAPLAHSIAELQHLRMRGLSASPDVSCCSCCCCCWGSCSSCSAATSDYLNQRYYLPVEN